jgi:hypothetical protein
MTLAGASMTGRKSNRGEYIRNSLAKAAQTMNVYSVSRWQLVQSWPKAGHWADTAYCILRRREDGQSSLSASSDQRVG